MIPTTQLRILRTSFLRTYPTSSSAYAAVRAPTHLAATACRQRRVQQQQQQQQQQPCLQPRAFTTTRSLLGRTDDQVAHLKQQEQQAAEELPAATTTTLSNAAANPPATTRPPPLDLPARGPDTSIFSHLFATGKAYLGFYKTGLKNIYVNWRLVQALDTQVDDPTTTPATATRSALLLRRRVRHDTRRLGPFALLLLVCGELTPFVVLAIPRLVPLTCRIPRQVDTLRQQAEARRRASWARLQQQQQGHGDQTPTRNQALAHVARSLDLVSPLWDRLLPPSCDGLLARAAHARVRRHLALLAEDDALLRRAGGVAALEPDEVALACEDRGVSVGAGRSGDDDDAAAPGDEELRERLGRALALTEPWRPRDPTAAVAAPGGGETDFLGTPEMIACVLVSGGWGGDTARQRGEMRDRAEEYCRAWGERLV